MRKFLFIKMKLNYPKAKIHSGASRVPQPLLVKFPDPQVPFLAIPVTPPSRSSVTIYM
jgi:hypothetical protein